MCLLPCMIAQVIRNDVVMPLYIEATLQLLPPVWYVLMLEPRAHWAAEHQKKSYTSIKATLPHWSLEFQVHYFPWSLSSHQSAITS